MLHSFKTFLGYCTSFLTHLFQAVHTQTLSHLIIFAYVAPSAWKKNNNQKPSKIHLVLKDLFLLLFFCEDFYDLSLLSLLLRHDYAVHCSLCAHRIQILYLLTDYIMNEYSCLYMHMKSMHTFELYEC